MTSDSLNRWLTLAANLGVLVGIILLLVELDQNATMMEAQISNERSSQGIDIFMAMADSAELSQIDATLRDSGFPDDTVALEQLTPGQYRQYSWYLRAERFRLENLLYQQTLGIDSDPGPIFAARFLIPKLDAVGGMGTTRRLESLIEEVEQMSE
jgi:hypothetical protein